MYFEKLKFKIIAVAVALFMLFCMLIIDFIINSTIGTIKDNCIVANHETYCKIENDKSNN